MAQIVNLSNAPNQSFSASLNINGGTTTLQLSLSYNRIAGYWVMGIADAGGNPLVSPVPLLTGVWPAANILMPYQYMNIGSAFVINVGGTTEDYPDNTNLGSSFILLWDNNDGYVSGQQFGGNVIIVGPVGPPGPPGVVGGLSTLGTSGTLTITLTTDVLTYQSEMSANVIMAPPTGGIAGQVFVTQLIQPPAGNCTVTWASYFTGLSSFSLDTTGNTQAVLWWQVNSTNTAAGLINVAMNGSSIL